MEITRVLAEEWPDVVLTFGPDGITGHPDHIAVGAATTAAFARLAGDGGPRFARLYHAAWKQSALDRLNAGRVADGLELFDPAVVFHPQGVPDEQIACTIDQRPTVPLIRAAFQAHRTQWAPFWAALDDRCWHLVAGENNLVQAWPPRPPGAAVRAAAGRTGSCLDNAVAESFFAPQGRTAPPTALADSGGCPPGDLRLGPPLQPSTSALHDRGDPARPLRTAATSDPAATVVGGRISRCPARGGSPPRVPTR
jgi:hypothetical protein